MNIFEKIVASSFMINVRDSLAYYGLRTERTTNLIRSLEYLNWLNMGDREKFEGDFLEFGVASGQFIARAFIAAKRFKQLDSMRFFGFDSFEGLPETQSEFDPLSAFKKDAFAYSTGKVEKNLKKVGLGNDKLKLIKGFYNETLKKSPLFYGIKKIAYVHIDCDLYDSTIGALDFVKNNLVNGAILDFDDYFCYESDNYGEPKALMDFIKHNREMSVRQFSRYGPFSITFTITRNV